MARRENIAIRLLNRVDERARGVGDSCLPNSLLDDGIGLAGERLR